MEERQLYLDDELDEIVEESEDEDEMMDQVNPIQKKSESVRSSYKSTNSSKSFLTANSDFEDCPDMLSQSSQEKAQPLSAKYELTALKEALINIQKRKSQEPES